MAQSALVLQVLISGPGDFPREHREAIHSVMRSWNAAYGRTFGVVFSPVDYQESASPGTGPYAQAVLNEQIVEDSDTAIVVLTDRMGTPTPAHPSGTAEEVDLMISAGKEVAVYLNDCAREPNRGAEALDQQRALGQFIQRLQERAFTGRYTTLDELRANLNVLLPRVASKFSREVADALVPSPSAPSGAAPDDSAPGPAEGVWPRVEVTESPETDKKGRLRTKRRWRLVLESTVPRPVSNVRYRYEDGQGNPAEGFSLRDDPDNVVEILRPRGSVEFPILRAFGSPSQATCVVTWEDDGHAHETKATVRTR